MITEVDVANPHIEVVVDYVASTFVSCEQSATTVENNDIILVQLETEAYINTIIEDNSASVIEVIETPAILMTYTDIGVQGMRGAQGESATLTIPELLGMFKQASTSLYTEYTKVGSNITKVEVWDTTEKTTKLFNKDITYLNGAVIGYIISDLLDNKILTVTYIFDVDGGIISKEANII